MVEKAGGLFFTGGDPLRIASQIGDTPAELAAWALHRRGGVIAGTSAGASVMSETMLAKGSSAEAHGALASRSRNESACAGDRY